MDSTEDLRRDSDNLANKIKGAQSKHAPGSYAHKQYAYALNHLADAWHHMLMIDRHSRTKKRTGAPS